MQSVYKIVTLVAVALLFQACGSDDDSNFKIKSSTTGAAASLVPTGSPTALTLKIYSIRMSLNEDCTDSIEILNNGAEGAAVNFFTGPDLFNGVLPDGSYKCVMFEMDDVINFQADATAVATHASCVDTTTTYSHDIYREGESDDGLWVNSAGVAVDATGSRAVPGSDRISIFASRNADAAIAGALNVHPNQSLILESDLVVPGETTFYADFANTVDENSGACTLEQGAFGFR